MGEEVEIGEDGYYSTTGEFIEAPRKQSFRLQVPYAFRFSILWTIFFALLGIIIQSIEAEAFIFRDFFAGNYLLWFKSFMTFTDQTTYGSYAEIFSAIFEKWYYFFYTGGLIAFLWNFLSWIINFEFSFRKKEKTQIEQAAAKTKSVQSAGKPVEGPKQKMKRRINELLAKGFSLLAEKKLKEAEIVYDTIRQEYRQNQDTNRELYNRIKAFYESILNQRNKNKKSKWA